MLKKTMGLAAAALMLACGSGTDPEFEFDGTLVTAPVEVTLEYGQEVQLTGSALKLVLAAVPEDSRCPVDVTCVWAGNAVVEIGVTVGMGPTVPIQINSELEPRWADWNDIRLTVLELTPVPVSDVAIRMDDYGVRLRLEPVF